MQKQLLHQKNQRLYFANSILQPKHPTKNLQVETDQSQTIIPTSQVTNKRKENLGQI